MAQVLMKTNIAGPEGSASAGSIYYCTDAEAKILVKAGAAEYVKGTQPPVEVAQKEPDREVTATQVGKRKF